MSDTVKGLWTPDRKCPEEEGEEFRLRSRKAPGDDSATIRTLCWCVPFWDTENNFLYQQKLTQCICTFKFGISLICCEPQWKLVLSLVLKLSHSIKSIKSNDHMLLDSVNTSAPGIHESLWTVVLCLVLCQARCSLGEEGEYWDWWKIHNQLTQSWEMDSAMEAANCAS